MPYKGKLDGDAIETSISIALDNAYKEYKEMNRRTIEWQFPTQCVQGQEGPATDQGPRTSQET